MIQIKVVKRDGTLVDFDEKKIIKAIQAAFNSVGQSIPIGFIEPLIKDITANLPNPVGVEEIQNKVEKKLMESGYFQAAKSFILYREKHKEIRFLEERIKYMEDYANAKSNAASSSETDDNSNVSQKNVANLTGEVYKTTNRLIQRQRMKKKLQELFPEVADQYEKDLNDHIIYVHDESSFPTLAQYCGAYTLYPLMAEGTGNIDGVTPTPPNDIQSFSGQVTNLVFLLSSQTKGAVALGDYFIALSYYVIKEFGEDWYNRLKEPYTNHLQIKQRTIEDVILKGMKQFIYGVNQPAGNRSSNSPFTNISYCDKNYFKALFGEFYYPDGTQPKWESVDMLQRMFIRLHRELRLIKPLTFPVSTVCMVHDGKEYLDEDYKELCAEEWAKGSSHFAFVSDNPMVLSSCCRVLNELSFTSTTGGLGVMTGSANVITLNLNRITQDYFKTIDTNYSGASGILYQDITEEDMNGFKKYLIDILKRVYKYHIAYKTMLYEQEEKKMYSASNAGYLYLSKLYCTIGVIGYFEAAKYLGIETTYNPTYIKFLQEVFGVIRDENLKNSIKDKKRPFIFNCEAVPGESLGVKFYNWDKEDNYKVPEDQNLYNCYFYNPWDETDILSKMKLHGKEVAPYLGGGQAAHLNLSEHLSKEQYLKLLDNAMEFGTNYFTFNIPMTECKKCGHVVNAPVNECPICHSTEVSYWTRIIGYLTKVDNWSNPRMQEFKKRVYSKNID